MIPAVLAVLYIFTSPDVWTSPEASVGLVMFEGEWGFTSLEPEDSWFGQGFLGGAAACGGTKVLNLDVREEAFDDGTRYLVLRKHPDAESGTVIRTLDVTDDDRATLTAELLGETEVFERNGETLTLVQGEARVTFERCQ